MKLSPVTGLLSLFALMCVGLIAGLNSIGSNTLLTANTYYTAATTTTAASTTTPVLVDPVRRNKDGGEEGNGPNPNPDEENETATTTIDLNNIQVQLPDWYVPIQIPTTTPGTGVTPSPVQPNDSAPRVLITTQPPVPAPLPQLPPQGVQNTPVAEQPVVPKPPVVQPENADESKERINNIGSSLRQFQREVRRVENAIRERVTREVETALEQADRTSVKNDEQATKPFNVEVRQKRIQELTSRLSRDVRTSIASGEVQADNTNDLQPVLKSSLEELRLLIKADTGVDVDLSPSARTVVDVVAENNPQVEKAREELLSRDGLDLYGDSDHDGISNFDERHIYNSDPLNAFTSGSSLTDGERILLGFDVLTQATEQVPVESPKVAGGVVENVFEVHSINVALKPLDVQTEATEVSDIPAFKEEITFTGRALPNSFVTIYIFSTPVVVTVKADASGAWSYTLDTELEDGDHELYVATVDAGGRILAKSPAVPFIKRAEAAEFTPLLIPETPEVTPLSLLQDNLTLVGIVAFIVFALIALIILGVLRSGPKEPTVAA